MIDITEEVRYDSDFYKDNINCTQLSPGVIFKIMLDLMDIDSLCDVGGGIGLWTKGFIDLKGAELDLSKVRCMDGDYINPEQLLIPRECFIPTNLEDRIPKPSEKFDLAMSLEVAEHLSPERADSFVEDLTLLSDVVLFSAAIPGQGGTGHINEQHMIYWVEKFRKHGYEPFDIIRPEIQERNEIPVWYRQNTMLYVKKGSKWYDTFSKIVCKPLLHTVDIGMYETVASFKEIFEKEKNDLWKTVESINNEKESLHARINKQESEYWQLKSEYDQLNSSNNQLKSEYDAIKKTLWYRFFIRFRKK